MLDTSEFFKDFIHLFVSFGSFVAPDALFDLFAEICLVRFVRFVGVPQFFDQSFLFFVCVSFSCLRVGFVTLGILLFCPLPVRFSQRKLFRATPLLLSYLWAWKQKVRHNGPVVASQIDHVVCLGVSAVFHASSVDAHVVQLLVVRT